MDCSCFYISQLAMAMVLLVLSIHGSSAFSTSDYLFTLSRHLGELNKHSEEISPGHKQRWHSDHALISSSCDHPVPNLDQIRALTPNDHYAKHNPGAGWAGYTHPLYGGYLNNLKQNKLEYSLRS